jgi:hypothetical protein
MQRLTRCVIAHVIKYFLVPVICMFTQETIMAYLCPINRNYFSLMVIDSTGSPCQILAKQTSATRI